MKTLTLEYGFDTEMNTFDALGAEFDAGAGNRFVVVYRDDLTARVLRLDDARESDGLEPEFLAEVRSLLEDPDFLEGRSIRQDGSFQDDHS